MWGHVSPEKPHEARVGKQSVKLCFRRRVVERERTRIMDSKRAKTARGRRALRKMEPKVIENPRATLVLRGQKSSALVNTALTDIYMLKKPNAKHFARHNAVHPFEDATPLEFLCQKNDASLFAFGSHSKKRPNNLVLGRLFDHRVLDMYELGVEKFTSISQFAATAEASYAGGTTPEAKPCLLFQGAEWEHQSQLQDLRSLLTDFFHGQVVSEISPLGVEHFLSFTASADGKKIYLRHYLARLMKSSEGNQPYCALSEIGPSLDLSVRRTSPADQATMKAAMVRPKASAAKPTKEKNVTRSRLMGKQGKLHVPRQDLSNMATARMKAYKTKRSDEAAGGEAGGGKKARVE